MGESDVYEDDGDPSSEVVSSLLVEEAKLKILKLQLETEALQQSTKRKFWDVGAKGVFQALIAGLVAGTLLVSFLLDNFLKTIDLIDDAHRLKIEQEMLIEKSAVLNLEAQVLEDERVQLDVETNEIRAGNERLRKDEKQLSFRRDQLELQTDEQEGILEELKLKCNNQLRALEIQQEALAELSKIVSTTEGVSQKDSNRAADITSEIGTIAEENLARARKINALENSYFAVIATVYQGDDVVYSFRKLSKMYPESDLEVYRTTDSRGKQIYAITLGGYLDSAEAARRVDRAREGGRKDACRWQSQDWGGDVSEELERN